MTVKHLTLAGVMGVISSKYSPWRRYRGEKNPKKVAPLCAEKRTVLEAAVKNSVSPRVRQGQ